MTNNGGRSSLWLPSVGLVFVVILAMWVGRSLRRPAIQPSETVREVTNPQPTSKTSATSGELVYLVHCAKCHGPEGHGDGEAALKIQPPPRNFARRPWRFAPTKEAIRRVTEEGIPGTAMPAAKLALSEKELTVVVDYVLQLAGEETNAAVEPLRESLLRQAGFHASPQSTAAVDFELTTADGKTVRSADLRDKVVMLYFWGTSCEHCLKALPRVMAATAPFQEQGLVLLPVCADVEDPREAQELLSTVAPQLKAYVDRRGTLSTRLEIQSFPTSILMNRQGKKLAVGIGGKDWESAAVRETLAKLVATEEETTPR